MFTRKLFIALIIAVVTTITAFAQTNNPPQWTSPTGSWEGVVTNVGGGPPPFRVLMNFTADGGFTGSGDGDNAVGSPQYGVWERIGGKSSRTYAVTFRQLFYAPDSSSTGLGTIQQTVILNESGDTWNGPFVVRIYAPDGTLVFTGGGTATAHRIVSEPLL
ncbi:MAG: hypothetical protein ABI481_03115 [Pyrinomonadaceae bacterium]